MITFNYLMAQALIVLNAKLKKENTAKRIGGLFRDLLFFLQNLVLGIILKGEMANAAAIKAIADPKRGDTYKAADTGHYWCFDGTQWNDIGEIIPTEVPFPTNFPAGFIEKDRQIILINEQTDEAEIVSVAQMLGWMDTNSYNLRSIISNEINEAKYSQLYTVQYPRLGNSSGWTRYLFVSTDANNNVIQLLISRDLTYYESRKFVDDVWTDWVKHEKADFTNAANNQVVYAPDGVIPKIELHQEIDETADKAISPQGVLTGLLGINGIRYLDKTEVTGVGENIIVNPDYQTYALSTTDGYAVVTSGDRANYKYSASFIAVKSKTNYLCNVVTNYIATPIYCYDAQKKFIGCKSINEISEFTTPENCAFVRYTQRSTFLAHSSTFLKEVLSATSAGILSALPYLSELLGAKKITVPVEGNILPQIIVFTSGQLTADGASLVGAGRHSDYIEIGGGLVYETTIPKRNSDSVGLLFYDADHTLLQTLIRGPSYKKTTFNTPLTTKYMVVNLENAYPNLEPYYAVEYIGNAISFDNLYITKSHVLGSSAADGTDYIAVGDSNTAGLFNGGISYADFLAPKFGGTYTRLGVSGASWVSATSKIKTQIDTIPSGFKGLVTILAGANDVRGQVPLGSLTAALQKPFDQLTDENTFAEALRLNLEILIKKAPDCILVGLLPLYSSATAWSLQETYRAMQKEMYTYYAIPYVELQKLTKLSPLTLSIFTSDNESHLNSRGHKEAARVIYGAIQPNIVKF